jgi:hypothetical protein
MAAAMVSNGLNAHPDVVGREATKYVEAGLLVALTEYDRTLGQELGTHKPPRSEIPIR